MSSTAVVKQKTQFELAITDNSWSEYLKSVIGTRKNEFISNMIALVNNNPSLNNVPANELINAGLQATSMNLPLEKSLGCAYVIPYKGHAQFQTGKDGYIQLALRTEKYKVINTCTIYSVDELKNEGFLHGKPYETALVQTQRAAKKLTTPIGYIATFVTIWGMEKSLYVTMDQMKQHCQRYSESFKNDKYGKSLWNTDFNIMAEKTVIKNLLKHYGIKTPELNRAILSDQAVITDFDKQSFNYIDYPQNTDTVDAVATVVESKPAEQPKQIDPEKQRAIDKLKELFDSGVFNKEEKTIIRTNWKTDWKQAISDAEEAYKLKQTPIEEPKEQEPPF